MGYRAIALSQVNGVGAESIGQHVAQKLGFGYLNEAIVAQVAKDQGIDLTTVIEAERRKSFSTRVLEAAARGAYHAAPDAALYAVDETDTLLSLIRDAVRDAADRGSVVLVAHAACYACADRSDVLRVGVIAPLSTRASRVASALGIGDKEAARSLRKWDASRASYLSTVRKGRHPGLRSRARARRGRAAGGTASRRWVLWPLPARVHHRILSTHRCRQLSRGAGSSSNLIIRLTRKSVSRHRCVSIKDREDVMLDVLERQQKLTTNQWKIISAAILGDMLDFFDYGLIAFALAFIVGHWKLTYGQSAMILLAAGIGAVPGALVWGWLADRIGRRTVFIGTAVNFSIFTGIMALTPDAGGWIFLSVCRLFVGERSA